MLRLWSALFYSVSYSTPVFPTIHEPIIIYSTRRDSTRLESTLFWSTLPFSTWLYAPIPHASLVLSTLLYSIMPYSTSMLWYDLIWYGLRYPTLLYSTLLRLLPILLRIRILLLWHDRICSGLGWSDLLCSDLACPAFVWYALLCSDSVWPYLVWPTLLSSLLLFSIILPFYSSLRYSDLLCSTQLYYCLLVATLTHMHTQTHTQTIRIFKRIRTPLHILIPTRRFIPMLMPMRVIIRTRVFIIIVIRVITPLLKPMRLRYYIVLDSILICSTPPCSYTTLL